MHDSNGMIEKAVIPRALSAFALVETPSSPVQWGFAIMLRESSHPKLVRPHGLQKVP